MGIMTSEAVLLAKYIKEYSLNGRCLSYGKQAMFFNLQRHLQIMEYAGFFKIENGKVIVNNALSSQDEILKAIQTQSYLNDLKPLPHYKDEDWMKADWISDDFFFQSVGFNQYDTLDATDYEHATHIYNLNHNNILDTIKEPYDLLLDTGTIEHVFDTRNFFKNVFDSLNVGGYVFHCTPTNNHVDHGFYQISPTLFHDYYAANNFNLVDITLFGREYDYVGAGSFAVKHDYKSGSLDHLSFGKFDNRIYVTAVLAQKTSESTWDAIPEQGTYKNHWEQK